jgi:hypothetical protein
MWSLPSTGVHDLLRGGARREGGCYSQHLNALVGGTRAGDTGRHQQGACKSAVAWEALSDLSRIGRTREASRRMRKLTKDLSPAARPKRWKYSLVMRTGQKSEPDATRQEDLPRWSWSFFAEGKVMMMSSPAGSKWQALSCLKQASLHRDDTRLPGGKPCAFAPPRPGRPCHAVEKSVPEPLPGPPATEPGPFERGPPRREPAAWRRPAGDLLRA